MRLALFLLSILAARGEDRKVRNLGGEPQLDAVPLQPDPPPDPRSRAPVGPDASPPPKLMRQERRPPQAVSSELLSKGGEAEAHLHSTSPTLVEKPKTAKPSPQLMRSNSLGPELQADDLGPEPLWPNTALLLEGDNILHVSQTEGMEEGMDPQLSLGPQAELGGRRDSGDFDAAIQVTDTASLVDRTQYLIRRRRTSSSYYVTSLASKSKCPGSSKEFTHEECKVVAANLLRAKTMMSIESDQYPKGCSLINKPHARVVFNTKDGKSSISARRLCRMKDVLRDDAVQQRTTTTTTPPAGQDDVVYGYVVGGRGTSSCPPGSRKMNKHECEQVAKSMKGDFVGEKEENPEARSCYQDDSTEGKGKVHFGPELLKVTKDAKGQEAKSLRPICMMKPPAEGDSTPEKIVVEPTNLEPVAVGSRQQAVGSAGVKVKAMPSTSATTTSTTTTTSTSTTTTNSSNVSSPPPAGAAAQGGATSPPVVKADDNSSAPVMTVAAFVGLLFLGLIAAAVGMGLSHMHRNASKPQQPSELQAQLSGPRGSRMSAALLTAGGDAGAAAAADRDAQAADEAQLRRGQRVSASPAMGAGQRVSASPAMGAGALAHGAQAEQERPLGSGDYVAVLSLSRNGTISSGPDHNSKYVVTFEDDGSTSAPLPLADLQLIEQAR